MTDTAPFALRFSTRTARRLSIVVILGLCIGYVGGAVLPDVRVMNLVRLAGLIAAVLLFIDGRGQMAQSSDRMLDERERLQRDSAYRATHYAMVSVLLVSFLYLMIGRKLGWWLPDVEAAVDLLSAFAIGSTALPGIILAWREPAGLTDELEG